MNKTSVVLLATGKLLVGKGVRSISAVTQELFSDCCDELIILTYSFGSGAKHILELIEQSLSKGVTVKLIINHLDNQPAEITGELRNLSGKYRNFKLVDFNEQKEILHAKVMVFDRKKAIIGSANLSWSAMFKNHEIGVLLEGDVIPTLLRAIHNF